MAWESDRAVSTRAGAQHVAIDEGLRAHMLRVYNYMTGGLALTGILAYLTANTPSVYNAIFGTPLMWVVMLAPLGLVFFLSARIHKMSFAGAQITYWIYAALMGLSMATVFAVFTNTSIARVFFITSGMFAAMSLYGYTTRRDLSGWGSFLFMGLIGIVIAAVVNMFVASSMLQFVISVIGVIVFTGLTAYDTQKIKNLYVEYQGHGGETVGKLAIMGALSLYLDFINLFIMLLHLLGNRE